MPLKRELTFFSAVTMGFADVGADIFVALGVVTLYAAGLTPLAFTIGAVLYICTALAYADLGSSFPVAGGASTFARKAYGDAAGFTAGWGLIMAYVLDIALFTIVGSFYLNGVLGLPNEMVYLIALGLLAVLLVVNLLGISESALLNNTLTIFAVCLLVIIGVLAYTLLFNFDFLAQQVARFTQEATWVDFAFAVGLSSSAFIGVESITQAAQETKRPSFTIPRAIRVVVVLVVVFTLTISMLAMGSVDWHLIADNKENALVAFAGAIPGYGAVLAKITGITGFLVCLVSANTGVIGSSRVMYSLSRHRLLPKRLAWSHPRFMTPWAAIAVFTLMAAPLLLVPLEMLVALYAFGALVAYILVNLSLIRLKGRDVPTMYEVPLVVNVGQRRVPITGLIGVGTCIFAIGAIALPNPFILLVGGPWFAGGALLFIINRRRTKPEEPGAYEPETETTALQRRKREEPSIVLSFKLKMDERQIVDMAAAMAKEMKSKITLLHVFEVPRSVPSGSDVPEATKRRSREQMEQFRRLFEELGMRVDEEFITARDAASGIANYVEQHNVRAIIVGHAEGKQSPTVEQLKRTVSVPLLEVRTLYLP